MKKSALTILIFFLMLYFSLGAVDYSFKLFTYSEVNSLRQLPPLKRIKIYRRVIERYRNNIINAVKMRQYKKAIKLSDNMEDVMDYVLSDVRICVKNKKNWKNKDLRKSDILLRKTITELKGAQRAMPFKMRENLDSLINKLKYTRNIIFKFVNRLKDF